MPTTFIDKTLDRVSDAKILGISIGVTLGVVVLVMYINSAILTSSYYRASLAKLKSEGFTDNSLSTQVLNTVEQDTGIKI